MDKLKFIQYPNQTTIIDLNEIPTQAIPFGTKFYCYNGSSSGPKCEQNTIWIVFDQVSTLSADQMDRFRNVLRTQTGSLQVKSWRYTQKRNGRIIYSNVPNSPSSNYFEIDEVMDVMSG